MSIEHRSSGNFLPLNRTFEILPVENFEPTIEYQHAIAKILSTHDAFITEQATSAVIGDLSKEIRAASSQEIVKTFFDAFESDNPFITESLKRLALRYVTRRNPGENSEQLPVELDYFSKQLSITPATTQVIDNFLSSLSKKHWIDYRFRTIFSFKHYDTSIELITAAAHIDKEAAQKELLKYIVAGTAEQKLISQLIAKLSDFAHDDITINEDIEQTTYWGYPLLIDIPLPPGCKVREVKSRELLLIEDIDGNIITYAKLELWPGNNNTYWKSIIIDNVELDYHTSMDSSHNVVKDILDTSSISEMLQVMQIYNISLDTSPTIVQNKLRQLLGKPILLHRLSEAIQDLGPQLLTFFELLKDQDQRDILNVVNKFHKHDREDYLIKDAFKYCKRLLDIRDNYLGNENPHFKHIAKLIPLTLKQHVKDYCALLKKKHGVDWRIPSISLAATLESIRIAEALFSQEELTDEIDPDGTKEIQEALLEFIEENPQRTAILRSNDDYIRLQHILHQRSNPHFQIEQAKKIEFYQQVNSFMQSMEVQRIDISRTIEGIKGWIEQEKLPKKISLVLLGINKGDADEKIIQGLLESGFEIESVYGVDRNDYTAEFSDFLQQQNVQFIQGDISDPNFPTELIQGQTIAVCALWSQKTDIILEEGQMHAGNNERKIKAESLLIISDEPLPLERNEYAREIDEQVDMHGIRGIVKSEFQTPEKTLTSMFFVKTLLDRIMLLTASGSVPIQESLRTITNYFKLLKQVSQQPQLLLEASTSGANTNPLANAIYKRDKDEDTERFTIFAQQQGIIEAARISEIPPSIAYLMLCGFTERDIQQLKDLT